MQFSEMILNAPVQDNLSRSIRNLNKELKEICRKIADSGAADGKLVVVHDRGRVVFRESSRSLKYRKYLSKKTDRFYYLAKGRYLELLIRLLEYRQNPQQKTRKEHKKNIEKIDVLMEAFEKAGVDFAKITLSEEQYTWARANYNKKEWESHQRIILRRQVWRCDQNLRKSLEHDLNILDCLTDMKCDRW